MDEGENQQQEISSSSSSSETELPAAYFYPLYENRGQPGEPGEPLGKQRLPVVPPTGSPYLEGEPKQPDDALSSHHPALSADADALAAVLKLYRGWAMPDELAKKSGLGGTRRVMVAAQELATAGLALVERGMIKPAGVEVRS